MTFASVGISFPKTPTAVFQSLMLLVHVLFYASINLFAYHNLIFLRRQYDMST